MTPEERQIEELKATLRAKENALAQKQRACSHNWTVVRDDINEPSRYIEGDPPGMYGVDNRPGFYTSGRHVKRWKRTCSVCGKSEHTTDTEVVEVRPKF